jgi:hypothetical protein
MLAQVVLWHGKLDFQPIFTELIILLSLFDLFRYQNKYRGHILSP